MFKLKMVATGMMALSMLGVAAGPAAISAQEEMKTYEVTITNLTSMQALSPPIIATHSSSAHAWQMGQVASEGVKMMAEEGMNDQLAAELEGVATDVAMGSSPLMPGKSVTLMIKARQGDVLSAATMLVQTNDGFTGLDNMTMSDGSKDAMAYDAGTEENDEKAENVPGPPFGGHMSGVPTNPRQPISMHPGIMGKADVGPEFNWSGPVARFAVKAMGGSMSGGMSGGTAGSTTGGTGSGMMPKSMPKTGAGDSALWLLLFGAGTLLLSGLAVRQAKFVKR